MPKVPGMFDAEASFASIALSVDPIDRKRTERSDNVMAMFHEEQPVWWEFAKPYIQEAVAQVPGQIDLKGRSWKDRVALHREIAKHGL